MRRKRRAVMVMAMAHLVWGVGCARDVSTPTPPPAPDMGAPERPDQGTDGVGEVDLGGPDAGEPEPDMEPPAPTPPGPTRVVPGVDGAQRLGSSRYRLGVSVGAPGASPDASPARASERYRLRLGPQPYLTRPPRPSTQERP